MLSSTAILWAILGGILPTLVWLWFWLREDQRHPEPPHLILACFVLGMCAVPLAVPFERLISSVASAPLWIFVGWAFVEEILKYGAAYIGGMHTQAEDEPIDALIYIITAALGFAAAENTLFILEPFIAGEVFTGLITINVRFVGTTLLHILASGIIGAAVAFSFYQKEVLRIEHALLGIVGAVALHALFNFLILHTGSKGMFAVFVFIWIAIIGLLIVFERIKHIRRTAQIMKHES
ncbi:MAG: PrsW family glutamic-type intramembrane protease [Patescibacteria group bacterium]